MPSSLRLSANLKPHSFDRLAGWPGDDHLAAFNCFLVSARSMAQQPYSTKSLGISAKGLAGIARLAMEAPANNRNEAREFFEKNFCPHKYRQSGNSGLLTGYFEPELQASRKKTPKYRYPLYRRPDDLIDFDQDNRPEILDHSYAFGRQTGGGIVEYFDRGQIEKGALAGRNLELFWLEDPVDVFFVHIQGSARLTLEDGSRVRLSYAAKTGHPYTAIGKILVERGEMRLDAVDMQSIRRWIMDNPARCTELLACNRSYIFFKQTRQQQPETGPVAAAGVALTAGRSLAVDRKLHTFGTPFWVETKQNFVYDCKPFSKLLIAQDTGSAIIGPERGDLFVGTGENAGNIAGRLKLPASMTVLVPSRDQIGLEQAR